MEERERNESENEVRQLGSWAGFRESDKKII